MAELTGIAYVNAQLAERTRQLDDADREIDSLRHRLVMLETAVAGITPAVAAAEERGYQRAITALRDEDRFLAWWTAAPEPTPTAAHRLAAEYLTAHAATSEETPA